MLSCFGSRCWISTKAMPLSAGKRVEELLEGVETTGRGPQCDDREINTRALRQRAPVRLRPGLAGLWRPASCHCLGFREPWFPSGERARANVTLSQPLHVQEQIRDLAPPDFANFQLAIELGMFRTLAERPFRVLMLWAA